MGGALLHLGLADIAQNFNPESAEDQAVLETFFAAEDRAMRDGTVGSDFAIITAVARPHAPTPRMDLSSHDATIARHFRLSLLFPPAQRLHHAVRALNQSGRLADDRKTGPCGPSRRGSPTACRSWLRRQHPRCHLRPRRAVSRPQSKCLTWMTERELQAASLRVLAISPPGTSQWHDDGLHFVGYAGAAERSDGQHGLFC